MALATWGNVGVALGRSISDLAEQRQVTYWLEGIELLVKARFGDLSQLDQDVLKYVETEAVAAKVRRLVNDGASSITVAVDDGNVTRRFENAVDAGDITDEWWDLLQPATAADAFTISPYATRQQPIRSCVDDGWRSAP